MCKCTSEISKINLFSTVFNFNYLDVFLIDNFPNYFDLQKMIGK